MSEEYLKSALRANSEALFMIIERHEKDSKEYKEALLKTVERQDKDSKEKHAKLEKLMLKQTEEWHNQKNEVLKSLQCMGFNQFFNRNLILNPSGKDCFKNWQIKHGGDGLIVEDPPEGSDLIPEEAGLSSQSCFVTSHGECERMQQIDLHCVGVSPWVMKVLKPRITASEWMSA
ncbi:unnamed protein product, partial [Meganyctiphanes norvegica]